MKLVIIMPDRISYDNVTDFESALRSELEIVLNAHEFLHSPVLSKLLAYLAEQTLAGNRRLKAYEIAVSGLNRSADFDPAVDSYPRVQVARLRHTLETFYARNPDKPDPCLFIPSGQYGMRVSRREIAYPNIISHARDVAPIAAAIVTPVAHAPVKAMLPEASPLPAPAPVPESPTPSTSEILLVARQTWFGLLALGVICALLFAAIVVVALIQFRH